MRGDPDGHEAHQHCGCCGCCFPATEWCVACRGHVLPVIAKTGNGGSTYLPFWDRTWTAQHGTSCPHQVGS